MHGRVYNNNVAYTYTAIYNTQLNIRTLVLNIYMYFNILNSSFIFLLFFLLYVKSLLNIAHGHYS
jgi:hypothetical protein